jgi:hypothetical protein
MMRDEKTSQVPDVLSNLHRTGISNNIYYSQSSHIKYLLEVLAGDATTSARKSSGLPWLSRYIWFHLWIAYILLIGTCIFSCDSADSNTNRIALQLSTINDAGFHRPSTPFLNQSHTRYNAKYKNSDHK